MVTRVFYRKVMMTAEVPRPLFLGFVLAGALGAVLVPDPRTSSFLAGFAAGAGMVFVLSFLRNPRRGGAGHSPAGESASHDEDSAG